MLTRSWLILKENKNQRPNNFDSKRKQNKFHKNMGNRHRGYKGNNYKGFKPQDFAVPWTVPNKNTAQKNS